MSGSQLGPAGERKRTGSLRGPLPPRRQSLIGPYDETAELAGGDPGSLPVLRRKRGGANLEKWQDYFMGSPKIANLHGDHLEIGWEAYAEGSDYPSWR